MKPLLTLLALFMVTIGPMQLATAGEVTRAQFTSAIEQREPVDEVTLLSNNINKVHFFSELRDMQGQTVIHRWQLDGKVMAKVSFDIAGPRWRVNSSKTLLPGWVGDWTVAVIANSDTIINEYHFQYIETEQ